VDSESSIRMAAFRHLDLLRQAHGMLPWSVIDAGFEWNGDIIRFATRARGIFKPRQMTGALSIKTVLPKPGRRIWYDDQIQIHYQR